MTYFSLTFLLVFLPAGLALFLLTPRKKRYCTLFALSIVFYVTQKGQNLTYLALMTGMVFAHYILANLIHRWEGRRFLRGAALAVGVLGTLAVVFYYLMGARLLGIPIPAGLLVYALSSTGYAVDLYRGEIGLERNFLRFFLYNCFFGRILLGPYARYSIIRPQIKGGRFSLASASTGLSLIVQGVAKKVVLADHLLAFHAQIASLDRRDATILSAWLLAVFFLLGVYYSLSAYCDIARGVGQIFSFKLARNIYYPLHVNSIREFCARFNTTLFEFLRRYVYRPLGGASYGVLSDSCNTVLYMMLFGAWFAMTPNCILWGAFLAFWMLCEKYLYGRFLKRMPLLLTRLYTYLVILLSFALLSQDSLPSFMELIRLMFCFTGETFINDPIIYILSQGYWTLALGLIFSLPVLPRMMDIVKRHFPAVASMFMLLVNTVLLAASLMYLI